MSSQLINRVLELTNKERSKVGLEPLKLNKQLANAADNHSDSMARDDFFSHTGADGSSVSDRVINNGYEYSTVGENIAAGQRSAEEVVQTWMDSPGHRANILNPDYTEIGIGYEYLENDTGAVNYNHYWTQVFGTSLNNDSQSSALETNSTAENELNVNESNSSPEIESTTTDLEIEENQVIDNSEDDSEANSVDSNSFSEDNLDLNHNSGETSENSQESAAWEFNDSAMLEDNTQDYVTGNTNDSVLTGGKDDNLSALNESVQVNDFSESNYQHLYELLSKSWLGSWLDNLSNYAEIEAIDIEYTNMNSQQYLMEEYQSNDL